MNNFLGLFLTLLFFASCTGNNPPEINPIQLKCNNYENPSGTERIPVFNWIVSSPVRGAVQEAYQIILDPEPGNLKSGRSCLWNSGRIQSSRSAWIQYTGPGLKSGTRYYWRVRLWGANNEPSSWSEQAFFITGLFENADWGDAKWIGYEEIPDSLLLVPGVHGNGDNLGAISKKRTVVPYFRKEFQVTKRISQATVFISGLGQYELHVNGEKVGDRFLSPGWTNYNKTCFYNTFDITENLKPGMNAIGVIVGNGFYNINRERYRKLVIAWGAPKMILKLIVQYSDGSEQSFVSDNTWKTYPSPITYTSIYGGEDYDARLEQAGWDKAEFNDQKWSIALAVREPSGELKTESDYPLKIIQTFESVNIMRCNDSTYVYDFGQNASGIIKLAVQGNNGQKVSLLPGELIGDDSLVTQKASGEPFYFTYILRGTDEEIWTPRFSYYGFRYIQVTGGVPTGEPNPDRLPVISVLQLLHTRNSSPGTGSFKCSNELFNSIHELINWSVKSNLASVATDCPHREKLGWLEQTHLMGNSIRYLYDIHNLYNKIIDDMIEAQLENGLVPDIAPEYVPFLGGFRDSPEWGSACIILPWYMYEWYGDSDAVKKSYPMMKRYLAYLESRAEKNILSHGLGDWYDLGPDFPGEAQLTPKAVTATSIYYNDARLLAEMAVLAGENKDAFFFKHLAENIRISFNKEFFNPKTKIYSTGSQTSYAMPLFFGMVDDKVRKEVVSNLVKSINENNKALTAGDIGYRYLLRVLEQDGESQLIYEMNSKTDVPGYGFQLAKGATSLTESWAGLKNVSNNHMMLGHLLEWFYSGLAGIRQFPGSKGYDHILISPDLVGNITWVEATCQTIHGKISSSWNISGGNLTMRVSIPVNCVAKIEIPFSDPDRITESSTPLKSSQTIRNIEKRSGKTICDVPSGDYIFVCTY